MKAKRGSHLEQVAQEVECHHQAGQKNEKKKQDGEGPGPLCVPPPAAWPQGKKKLSKKGRQEGKGELPTLRASSSSSAAGTAREASPILTASAALMRAPVRTSSMARLLPTARARRWVPPMPGMTPSEISGCGCVGVVGGEVRVGKAGGNVRVKGGVEWCGFVRGGVGG